MLKVTKMTKSLTALRKKKSNLKRMKTKSRRNKLNPNLEGGDRLYCFGPTIKGFIFVAICQSVIYQSFTY
jgi:hypothetical protein